MRKASLAPLALGLVLACVPAWAQPAPAAAAPEDGRALRAAARDLCHSEIALLGEAATHGDGHTLAFKVALVEQLVDQCGFDTVLFEANQDEFLHLNQRLRSGQSVTSTDLLSAVGGLWKFYREFQPLAPFLLARAQSGRLFLAGLDDQLGQLGQDYANVGMVAELTGLLPEPERRGCSDALHQRIFFSYTEATPYSEQGRSRLDTCLAHASAASLADTTASAVARDEQQEMLSATRRWLSRDFSPDSESTANRDRSMFQTFEWLQSRRPGKHRIIVWAATVHIAKQGDPTWGDHAGTNLGSLIHRKFGAHARALGFSAVGGSFRERKGSFPAIPSSPPDSVETLALAGRDAASVYVGHSQLTAMGTRAGAFFRHSYQALRWSDFLDAIVVFRAEHPPTDTR